MKVDSLRKHTEPNSDRLDRLEKEVSELRRKVENIERAQKTSPLMRAR